MTTVIMAPMHLKHALKISPLSVKPGGCEMSVSAAEDRLVRFYMQAHDREWWSILCLGQGTGLSFIDHFIQSKVPINDSLRTTLFWKANGISDPAFLWNQSCTRESHPVKACLLHEFALPKNSGKGQLSKPF
jgi:hypothetical protein